MDALTDLQIYRRTFGLTVLVLAAMAFGVGRLAYLQFVGPPVSASQGTPAADGLVGTPTSVEPTATLAPGEPTPTPIPDVILPAVRGNIYDCHGYLLAVSTAVYDIAAAPREVTDTNLLADRLAPLLHRSRAELLDLLALDPNYAPLAIGVQEELKARILSWDLSGVYAEVRPGRFYPHDSLAAHVLGFVNMDGDAAYGLESKYDRELGGQPGGRSTRSDAIGSLSYEYQPPRDGADLILTLDRNAQHIVEEALAQAAAANEATRGVAIVMEPASGAILAMAVWPSYDPNTRIADDPGVYTNAAISTHYEPGSVFKMFTVAAALDAGVITPASTYYDNGLIVVGGEEIENSDRMSHGETTMHELLAQSLNVGAAHLSTTLGALEFYEYVRRFGFNELTGVDLAYEVAGQVRFPGDREWHESDLATNSFGQGLAANPLQVLCAVSAVANRGVLMRPYLVQRVAERGTVITETVAHEVRRVISAEAAADVTEMLVYAVEHGITPAIVPGYKVAGKSGTSELPVPGGYDPDQTIASFAGYVPADDPRFAILVALHKPQKEHWGSRAAAPAFRQIAQGLLELYAVPPDSVRVRLQ
jgi:cell division protein FtsI (penicillin-binding protein 3)